MSPAHDPFDLDLHRGDLTERRRVEARWSLARLILFAVAAGGWIPLRERPVAAGAVVAIGLVLFAGAVMRHRRLRRARVLSENMLLVASESATRRGGRLVVVRGGHRPADAAVPEAHTPPILDRGKIESLSAQEIEDLDLYAAPVGLFGLLNRTSTNEGQRRLRDWLEHPALEAGRILPIQAAVGALTHEASARLTLQAAAAGLRRFAVDLDSAAAATLRTRPLRAPGLHTFLRIWTLPSAIVLGACLVKMAMGQYEAAYFAFGWLGLNAMLCAPLRREIRAALQPWLHLRYGLAELGQTLSHCSAALAGMLQASADELSALRTIQDAIDPVVRTPIVARLAGRLAWADVGGFLHAVFNLAFFYDVHVARAVTRLVLPHKDEIRRAMSALADLEALTSLACFVVEQPITCRAELHGESSITIEAGRHPLVDPQEVVANDLRLDERVPTWLITGSNMAGKSTFLRMSAVNVLLAQVSGFATADRMALCPVRLLTDLRIRDDLGRHESYFLAEVRQLRRMVLPPEDGVPVLGLIDEPFRGTNSQERLAAGEAVLSHLLRSPHFFLIATHEQQLTRLAESHAARNVHFREDLTERGPVFDYRLQPGPAHVRNALRVLEREGYPAGIIAMAQDLLRAGHDANSPPATPA
jgi:hypothetical protein